MIIDRAMDLFTADVNLKTISTTESKGIIMKLNNVSKTPKGVTIPEALRPNFDNHIRIVLEPVGEIANTTGESETPGSLTVNIYHASSSDMSTALTAKVATFTFKREDIDGLRFDNPALEITLPMNVLPFIQVGVSGTAFASGSVRIALVM